MNTNEFYKELFEKYALDEDKIRVAALKQAKTPAWKRAVGTYWKSAAGVAAAVAVTVGAVAFTAANSPEDITIKISPAAALSADERLHEAEMNYINQPMKQEERINIYVSFKTPLSYGDMAIAFSAIDGAEDIDVAALYKMDGDVIRDPDLIREFAENNSGEDVIAGVKVNTFASLYRDIYTLSSVCLAEIGSADINDDTFTPVSVDDLDPLISDIEYLGTETTAVQAQVPADTTVITKLTETDAALTTAEPTVTAVQPVTETSASQTSAETSATDDTTLPSSEETEDTTAAVQTDGDPAEEETEDTEPETAPDESEPAESTDAETEEEDTSEEETKTAEAQTTEETTTASQTEAVTETADVSRPGLMTGYYSLNVENALDTFIIGDDAIVLTKESVYFYRLGGVIKNNTQASVLSTANPKIAYVGAHTVVLTGCGASGARDQMIVFDSDTGISCLTDISGSLGGAEIGVINYNAESNKYFIKAVTSSQTCVFEADVTAEGYVIPNKLFDFDGVVTLAGYKNRTLYFSAKSDNLMDSLYEFDCSAASMRAVSIFDGECRIKRSRAFASFAAVDADSEVFLFDVTANKLTDTGLSGSEVLVFEGGGRIYISVDGKIYRADGDSIEAISDITINFDEKPAANYEVVEKSAENIVVAEKNKNIW